MTTVKTNREMLCSFWLLSVISHPIIYVLAHRNSTLQTNFVAISEEKITKLEKDIDDHLKRDYPDSFREKLLQIRGKLWKLKKEIEQRCKKK